MDALDLAVLIEQEAEERYVAFAEMIGSRYEGDAAAFFQTMSGYEAKHSKRLQETTHEAFCKHPRACEQRDGGRCGSSRPWISETFYVHPSRT